MVNGLHLYSTFIQSAVQLMPLIHPFTHSPIHPFTHSHIHTYTHTHIHQRWLAATQGTNQLVRSNWGLAIGGCSGTLWQARGGIEPATLQLPDDSPTYWAISPLVLGRSLTFLIIIDIPQGEILHGAPDRGRLAVTLCFFHFLIIAPTVVNFSPSCLLIFL